MSARNTGLPLLPVPMGSVEVRCPPAVLQIKGQQGNGGLQGKRVSL